MATFPYWHLILSESLSLLVFNFTNAFVPVLACRTPCTWSHFRMSFRNRFPTRHVRLEGLDSSRTFSPWYPPVDQPWTCSFYPLDAREALRTENRCDLDGSRPLANYSFLVFPMDMSIHLWIQRPPSPKLQAAICILAYNLCDHRVPIKSSLYFLLPWGWL
ncbi:hypothetical protein EDC04DRAFT_1015494 [Pisolithus marmoratus]|nr:hypothetical protein EDC04DRAFT_1015494 [Pisolithus marmoratus]